ncbi:MAG TPA: hypothetical protein VFV01_00175 [Spirillospora sp.]|nr:hypothetical protein [Spirillospora sp.]
MADEEGGHLGLAEPQGQRAGGVGDDSVPADTRIRRRNGSAYSNRSGSGSGTRKRPTAPGASGGGSQWKCVIDTTHL